MTTQQPMPPPWRCLLPALLLMLCDIARGEAIQVEHAALTVRHGGWHLDAHTEITLSNEVRQSLLHGIALQIHTELRVCQPRAWLWDGTLGQHTIRRQLQYRPLTERFAVSDMGSGEYQSFHTLRAALAHMGTFREQIVLHDADPPPGAYYATLRSMLDIASLPVAMRLVAWFSAAWKLSSTPYRWELGP